MAISIHAPREGGDFEDDEIGAVYFIFQSTPPARGATKLTNPRISKYTKFQSTPPARGATFTSPVSEQIRPISIHAPREGGDSKDAQFYLRIFDK